MSETLPPGEKARVGFAAIVLLLRQMAHQLLQDGRTEEARGLIDGIDALREKAKGNLDDEEQKFVDDVLYELQMRAVKGPAEAGEEEGESEDGPAGDGDESPSGGEAGG